MQRNFYLLKSIAVHLTRYLIDIYNWVFAEKYVANGTQLEKQLAYCSKHIPFYRSRGLDLDNYPIINKAECNQNRSAMRNHFGLERKCYTSGTTGSPAEFLRDARSIAAEQYFLNGYYQRKSYYWIKLRGGKLFDVANDSTIVFREIPLIREMHVCSHRLNDATLAPFVDRAMNISNKCLYSAPSVAASLAEFCQRKSRPLRFEQIALSSETLYPHQLELIEGVFQCPVKDLYGQVERVAALTRCPVGNYHPIPTYSHIEYINRGDNLYEIVGTVFHNKAMPLVRYATEDLVEISDKRCSCGSDLPTISKIHGRKSDWITLNGNSFSASLFSVVVSKTEGLVESQFVIHGESSLTLHLVVNENYDESQELKLRNALSVLVPDELVSLKYVEEIKRTRT